MLHFDRKLDNFGDVLTHGYNLAKMRNKRKIQHTKDGTERGQKSPWAGRPGVLGPAGLALFGVQSISVFFSAKYASTLICVLPKPPTISAYKYPEAAVKEEDRRRIAEGQQKRSRGSREEHPEIHSS